MPSKLSCYLSPNLTLIQITPKCYSHFFIATFIAPLLYYSYSPLIHHTYLLMAYSSICDACMVAWLLSNQRNSGRTQMAPFTKLQYVRTYVPHISTCMSTCVQAWMSVSIAYMGEKAEEKRKVIGPHY